MNGEKREPHTITLNNHRKVDLKKRKIGYMICHKSSVYIFSVTLKRIYLYIHRVNTLFIGTFKIYFQLIELKIAHQFHCYCKITTW